MLHMGWHVLDGADGDLARMTGRASPQGELFDGICDYVGTSCSM
jgi:phosphatidylglycerophosphate synthase